MNMTRKILFCLLIAGLSTPSKSAVYSVIDFGAKNNRNELTTFQIQNAIDRCSVNGGGVVYIPQGEYLVGTLNLRSGVEFHLESGAVLKATTDLSQYQKHNEQPARVFYTEDANNVSITGLGRIFSPFW
jgi:polygalacturonase